MKILGFLHLFLFFLFSGYADEFSSQKAECKENSAMRWDNVRNRCLINDDFKNSFDGHRKCLEYESKEERDGCMYDELAKVGANVSMDDFEMYKEAIIQLAQAGVTITNVITMKEGHSSCMSLKISAGCGGVAILKDIYVYNKAKRVVEFNKSDFLKYTEENKESKSYDLQVYAYESKIKQLYDIKSFYEEKAKYHKITSACYAVAFGASFNDALMQNNVCLTADGEKKDLGGGDAPKGIHAQFMQGSEGWASKTKSWLSTPWGVMTVAAMNVGWNLNLASEMEDQAYKAETLAKKMEVTKRQFESGMAQYCPNGHDNKSEPTCYCYEDGKKKSNRSNSETCKALWAKNDRNLYAKSSDKSRGSVKTAKEGCIKINGEFDPNCECRRFKDQRGNNACKKMGLSQVNLGGLEKSLNVAELEKAMNDAMSGLPIANLGAISDNVSKALSDKVRSQLYSKIPLSDKNGKPIKVDEEGLGKLAESYLKNVKNDIVSGKVGSLPGSSAGPISAIVGGKSSETRGEKILPLEMVGGKGMGSKKKKKSEDNSFAMNYSDSSSSVQTFKEDYMDKTYDTRDADINSRKDVSIFKILTNRYNKSGYKRLFAD